MSSDNLYYKRDILRKVGKATTAGTLTGSIAGCQTGGTNSQTPTSRNEDSTRTQQNTDNEDDTTASDTEESLDVSFREFANKALIDPEVMLKEVIEEDDERARKGYKTAQGFDIYNVVSMMNQLSPENAQYLNENAREDIPWSVFNADLEDMKIWAFDAGDGTETALVDFSMEEALEGIESRDDIDIVESSNNYIEFNGEHSTYLHKETDSDPFYVHGYVVQTDLGVITTVTNGIAISNTIADGNDGVRGIARRHLELISEGGESLLDQETEEAEMAYHVLDRAEGTKENQPASEGVSLWYLKNSEDDPLEGQKAHQKDGYQDLAFNVVQEDGEYESVENEALTQSVPIEDHWLLEENSQ